MKKATLSILALGLLATSAAFGQTMNSSSSSNTTTTTTNQGSNNTVSAPTTGSMNNMGNANGSPTNLNNSGTTGGNYQTTPTTGTSGSMNSGTMSGSYNSTGTPATTTTGVNGGYNGTTNGTYNGTMNGTTGTMNNAGNYNSTTTTTSTYSTDTYSSRPAATKAYKAFTLGIYAGVNSTRLRGEAGPDGRNLSGRLGYQLGAFIRGGGRIYGQIGAEYFASSSNYFRVGDGSSLANIEGRIDQKYLQIPALVGVKLTQSDRGISAVRLAVGLEYANRLSGSNTVNINESEFRSGQFLGLVNLGFDAGPVFLDFMYHYGFANTINGFNNSDRRILSANFGFKF